MNIIIPYAIECLEDIMIWSSLFPSWPAMYVVTITTIPFPICQIRISPCHWTRYLVGNADTDTVFVIQSMNYNITSNKALREYIPRN